jgi:hypothetical protein
MCSVFACSIFALISFNTNRNKPILNQNWGTYYGKFERRRKICFQQQNYFGCLIARYGGSTIGGSGTLPIFAQDILKVGPEGFGVLRAVRWVVSNVNCFRLCAYEQKCRFEAFRIYFAFGLCIITFGLSTILPICLVLSGAVDFGSDSTNYFKTQITCAAEFLLLILFCRFVK